MRTAVSTNRNRGTTTRLLVCAATWMELRTWSPLPAENSTEKPLEVGQTAGDERVTLFVTGVGIPAALANTMLLLQRLKPARILNIGIAGAYPHTGWSLGDIVVGTSEVYGDVGFELPTASTLPSTSLASPSLPSTSLPSTLASSDTALPHFQSIRTSPFAHAPYDAPLPLVTELDGRPLPLFERRSEVEAAPEPVNTIPLNFIQLEGSEAEYAARLGRGCTVNQCTGSERTGQLRAALYGVDFESMEGAAIAQVGQGASIPIVQVRAISNYASTRDMRIENIRLALANLRHYLERIR